MTIGLVMLTASWGVTQNGWVICYVWSLFFYGIGVGGEYPMTATSGMENAVGSGKVSTKEDRLHRGRKVTSAFLMQGWGQFFNQSLLILLLLIFHHGTGNPPYSKVAAQWTYRISFAIPAFGTLLLVYYRAYKMKSASKQLMIAKKKQNVTGYDTQSLKLTFNLFGTRVLATAGTWYMNDVFFYGNKLFQSEFIAVLIPGNKSVMVGWLYNLLNVGVSLVGYYLASFLIDNKLCKFQRSPKSGFPSLMHGRRSQMDADDRFHCRFHSFYDSSFQLQILYPACSRPHFPGHVLLILILQPIWTQLSHLHRCC